MALVNDLKRSGDPFKKIVEKLAFYEELVSGAEPLFDLKGKLLVDAIKQHVQDLALYSSQLEECRTIEFFLGGKMEEVEASVYKHYLDSKARALSATDLKMYVRSDPQYVEANQNLLDVAHVRRQLEALVEAFQTMGWSLSNITKLKVAQQDHVVL
jgi:hypothetical protein